MAGAREPIVLERAALRVLTPDRTPFGSHARPPRESWTKPPGAPVVSARVEK